MPGGWFLLGAPWDSSGSGRGEAAAPQALRAHGLPDLVDEDLGDAATIIDSTVRDVRTGVLALPETVQAARTLTGALLTAMSGHPERRPLVVGGDCSILLGIIPALRRRIGAVGLWFLDGHPDYLEGPASASGETADMDLAVITGVGALQLTTLAGVAPMIAAEDVVLVGHRTAGLDQASAAELAGLPAGLRRIDAATAGLDPAAAGAQAVAWLSHAAGGAWLHLDLDVLDPEDCPAVTYPQPGGLTWDQLAAVLEPMAGSPRLLGLSVADFRPDLDRDGSLAERLVDLIRHILTFDASR